LFEASGVARQKFFLEVANLFTLSEQQYLFWDTASQSTKKFGGHGPLTPPWLRLCAKKLFQVSSKQKFVSG